MKTAVLGLSGGMDSTTLLGYLIEQGFSTIHVCNFQYGSKHNQYEALAFGNIVNFYREKGIEIIPHQFNLQNAFMHFESNLLKSGGDIPEGHYEAENMKLTVVPGRNSIFATIMAGLAESVGAEVVALGVHSGDHHIYPDCRDEFIKALNYAIYLSSEGKVKLIAPFINDTKETLLKRGYSYKIPVPYELTRTCYKDQGFSCGKCGSCRERLEAFELIGIQDPIRYE